MNAANFNKRTKSKESFVSSGVEIEDTHKHKNSEEESVRMQVILTKSQRNWLRRQAFESDSQMSKILRSIVDEAMKKKG